MNVMAERSREASVVGDHGDPIVEVANRGLEEPTERHLEPVAARAPEAEASVESRPELCPRSVCMGGLQEDPRAAATRLDGERSLLRLRATLLRGAIARPV